MRQLRDHCFRVAMDTKCLSPVHSTETQEMCMAFNWHNKSSRVRFRKAKHRVLAAAR